KVIQPLVDLRTGKEKKFSFEKYAQQHGLQLHKETIGEKGQEGTAWYVSNTNVFDVELEKMIHFVSKKGMNIVGLGEKIVEQLMVEGLVTEPADLFELTEGDVLDLEGFKEKSAHNLIASIRE